MKIASFSTMLGVALLLACDPEGEEGESGGTPQTTGPSLRIETWNTALMSITVNPPPARPGVPITIDVFEEKFNESYADRANAIADGILAGDQDVVALNEVFSDEARDILVDRLSAEYPHYVAKISGHAPMNGVAVGEVLEMLPPVIPADLIEYGVKPLDSGLMIFSRFPLLPLDIEWNEADCVGSDCEFWGQTGTPSTPITSKDFAFTVYEDCSNLDCLSSKGVALVKIDAPEWPTYVAFSHMQADTDYSGQYASDRGDQYEQITEFLSSILPENELINARLFLVGDLNTPAATLEWQDVYYPGAAPAFFSCGNNGPCTPPTVFTDAWGFETSPDDVGPSLHRLDYILHNSADGTMCMQHVMVAWENAENGADFHSDHKPLRADFNESARWCSPNTAAWRVNERPRELVFGEEFCDYDPATLEAPLCDQDEVVGPGAGAEIVHPGNFQWFRITQSGSYVLRITDADPDVDVDFVIYASDDLSRPLAPIDEDVPIPSMPDFGTGTQYSLPEPPYYIRTFVTRDGAPDRTTGGVPYTLAVHQNLCRTPVDACLIEPNQVQDYQWPDQSGSILSVSDVWFKFRTSGVKDGVLWPGPSTQVDPPSFPAELFIQEATVASSACLDPPVVEQYSDDGLFTLIDAPAWAEINGGGPFDDIDADGMLDGHYFAPELPGDTAGELKFYFAHLSRSCTQGAITFLEQQTTLTYLEPHRVTGLLQYDDSGIGEDDLIRFLFTFDADVQGASPPCEGACQHEFVFDEPDLAWQDADYTYLEGIPAMQGYYVNQFYPNLFEDEDDDDFLLDIENFTRGPDTLPWWQGGMGPLPLEHANAQGTIYVTDTGNLDSADYWYELEYEQRRRKVLKLAP